jgi:hypothetical protein
MSHPLHHIVVPLLTSMSGLMLCSLPGNKQNIQPAS